MEMNHALSGIGDRRGPDFDLKFPPLPKTVAEVSILLAEQGDVPDTPRLVALTHADPVVATGVLRRINSAYYGMSREVTAVRQAVFLLGFQEVCNLVLTAAMLELREILASDEQRDIFHQIIRESLAAAFYAQELALHWDVPYRNMAFTLGLLHNVGRLVLLYNSPDEYEALWQTTEKGGAPSAEEERCIFGRDHVSLARQACERWNLPPSIGTLLEAYRAPATLEEEALQPLARILAVSVPAAETLCRLGPSVPPFEPSFDLDPLVAGLPATTEELAALLAGRRSHAARYIESI